MYHTYVGQWSTYADGQHTELPHFVYELVTCADVVNS
jgi:hypothetical protein